ncbi:MAG: site-specific DNA-methyltransferase [Methanomassiliicoccaceae archaeon]|nr:site-specific DNA-methyltransferase [Methanomassiliicoccaceae archaeon]
MCPLTETEHKFFAKDSRKMDELDTGSVDLVVTSPPYPMISMWDDLFSKMEPKISEALTENGGIAFELMHKELDRTWAELKRVVKDGGIVCINVGDATRTINDRFEVYPNHARVISKMMELGFDVLPEIIWHKPTNSPNKFMGSGMLPAGAYVTLEHEYILIFRKNGKRVFSEEEKDLRKESSYFWEERNEWFSDIWEFKGIKQKMDPENIRERSAAFPCELPKRLILMFSLYGDVVLDPFLGTGTTTKAAMLFGRNSVGYEMNEHLIGSCRKEMSGYIERYGTLNNSRIEDHMIFIKNRMDSGKEVRHVNLRYGIPVMTEQECGIVLYYPSDISETSDDSVTVRYVAADKIHNGSDIPSPPIRWKIAGDI